jgi:30S ribosomal protein S31
MGRGDKKTKKGKIFKGSFGKTRPSKPASAAKKSAAKKQS